MIRSVRDKHPRVDLVEAPLSCSAPRAARLVGSKSDSSLSWKGIEFSTMRPILLLLLTGTLWGQPPQQPAAATQLPTVEEFKKRIASFPPDEQVYEIWRFWLVGQPADVQKLFDKDDTKPRGLEVYRKQLQSEGDPAPEIERKIRIIAKDGERWEIERWNRTLTSNSPRINWQPNHFLVAMAQGRKPGRALDVGMGQGRNAIWLAQQGWDTTGYDPAEKAVMLARETATRGGIKLNSVVAKDSDFDMGVAKWDLILLSYVEVRDKAEKVIRALAPGGIVVVEYFHADVQGAPGGFADNELLQLFGKLRVIRYEDTEDVADFGMDKVRLVRLCAEKRR
jgi:SAM-dependent methyltransferase